MLTVAILNYNGKGMLERCLESIAKQSIKPDEILVVDNASTDDSWKIAKKYEARVYHADNRHKFISGLNDCLREAKGDKIIFMENDIRLHSSFVHEVRSEQLSMSKWDCLVPAVYSPLGKRYEKGKFHTACFTMEKSCFEFVGEFDQNLQPAYWEDVDYWLRMLKMNMKIVYADECKAVHYANWSFSKVYSKKQMSHWCRRNAWYVFKKHFFNRGGQS